MTRTALVERVLAPTPGAHGIVAWLVGALGVAGIVMGFWAGPAVGWTAVSVTTVLVIGFAMFGGVLSAMFELTNARWGRPYRRLAEGSVVLMPVGLAGILAWLIGAGRFMPWVHGPELLGGKEVWLVRPFWTVRVVLSLLIAFAVGLVFTYLSLRRDFCVAGVRERYPGRLTALLTRGMRDADTEMQRCSRRLTRLAPALLLVYAVTFSLLGFDLIMSLEPRWHSTLFGAWYFLGHILSGLSLLVLVSLAARRRPGVEGFLDPSGQADLATLIFAFVLLNAYFFWSQYLVLWYGHVPDETAYIITRTVDGMRPWLKLSWMALAGFFIVPFVALLFRPVKVHAWPLGLVAAICLVGMILARFIEIAPALLHLGQHWQAAQLAWPLLSTGLLLVGCGGLGWGLFSRLLDHVPPMPVGDDIFLRTYGERRQ